MSLYQEGSSRKEHEHEISWEPFISPAECDRWVIAALVEENETNFDEDKLRQFISAFVHHCRQKGMKIGEPSDERFVVGATTDDVRSQFDIAKDLEASLIFIVSSADYAFHEKMKLIECREQVVTQEIRVKSAVEAPSDRNMLDSIVRKVNLKLGGTNYGVTLQLKAQNWIGEDTLLISISSGLPKGVADDKSPAAFGFCSNLRGQGMVFVGGYRFGWIKEQKLLLGDKVIRDIVAQAIRSFLEDCSIIPKQVVIFRQGLSPRNFSYAVERELPQVQEAYEGTCGSNRQLLSTFIVTSYKRPLESAVRSSHPRWQDSPRTRPSYRVRTTPVFEVENEDFKYCVLRDSANMGRNVLQSLVQSFSEGYGEESSPGLISAKMKKRAIMNLTSIFGEDVGSSKLPPIEELNTKFSYTGKALGNRLFTA